MSEEFDHVVWSAEEFLRVVRRCEDSSRILWDDLPIWPTKPLLTWYQRRNMMIVQEFLELFELRRAKAVLDVELYLLDLKIRAKREAIKKILEGS